MSWPFPSTPTQISLRKFPEDPRFFVLQLPLPSTSRPQLPGPRSNVPRPGAPWPHWRKGPVPQGQGTRTETQRARAHRMTAPEPCARGQGAPGPRAGNGPQRPNGRGASRFQAWGPVGLSPRPGGVGDPGTVRRGLTLALLTKRTSTATRARPATPTQNENTSHMEAAILGVPPPADP